MAALVSTTAIARLASALNDAPATAALPASIRIW
jgi:hypothetical protein